MILHINSFRTDALRRFTAGDPRKRSWGLDLFVGFEKFLLPARQLPLKLLKSSQIIRPNLIQNFKTYQIYLKFKSFEGPMMASDRGSIAITGSFCWQALAPNCWSFYTSNFCENNSIFYFRVLRDFGRVKPSTIRLSCIFPGKLRCSYKSVVTRRMALVVRRSTF